ncbi:hypothetical protein G6M84_17705 [Agrobacterium tumefaciens]|uniref:hypothetical protein n=1 Tax=Agrobacterium tumefaciens TaxID=358 RepID=UPI001573A625|nr:hypothetical protein [Agrobacterium tumefaciens]NTB98314.1 hypothetical protein [Agrobacterium tumefaciens]NTC45683.1 hypothetical protein [Agrobacterium tumefaciens]
MEELIERLLALFSKRVVQFGEDEGGKARALAALQPSLYQTILNILNQVPYQDHGAAGSVSLESQHQQILNVAIAHSRDSGPKTRNLGNQITLESAIPILDDDAVQAFRLFVANTSNTNRPAEEAKQFGFMVIAALVTEAALDDLFNVIEGGTTASYKGKFYVASSRYLAAKQSVTVARRIEIQIKNDLAVAQGQLDNYKAEFERSRESVRDELDVIAAAATDIKSSQAKAVQDIKESHETSLATIIENNRNFGEAMKQTREQLQSFEATAREEMKLESIRLSWERRFNEARWAFRIACGLLLVYLGVTIGSAYVFGLPIVKALANIEQSAAANEATAPSADTTPGPAASNPVVIPKEESVAVAIIHQFGRLIVFSVPVFVWLWAGRALMRYFMRSMLLMDDARQRQTMLDTYFLLSDKGRADERDRPLVLWALFRQTPGHGPDGIEPPDFTEVINAGLKRANAATGG